MNSTVTDASVTTTWALGSTTTAITWFFPVQGNVIFQPTASRTTSASSHRSTINTPGQFTISVVSIQNGTSGVNGGVTGGAATFTQICPQNLQSEADFPCPPRILRVAGGIQSPQSIGPGEPVGTNISASDTVTESALGWLSDVTVPVIADSAASITLQGSVDTTNSIISQTSRFGGFGFNSLAATVATIPNGIVQMTTCDSFSNTTTLNSTFDPVTNSTYQISQGQGMAVETVPQVASQSSQDTPILFLNYPAFTTA